MNQTDEAEESGTGETRAVVFLAVGLIIVELTWIIDEGSRHLVRQQQNIQVLISSDPMNTITMKTPNNIDKNTDDVQI